PLTMPLRVVLQDVAAWEIALSAVLLLAAAWGVIVLAGRLYAGALMRGGKVRWREAWRDAAHLR
ncbi:MAG: ABC transporter permease, partial [Acidimicrobiia bacterium]|nr:ABC transporter permease [Acidimicrobiia bacterium]